MFTSDRAGEARLDGRRVLITSGTRDPIVPADSVERLVTTLTDRGATVDAQAIAAGHELTQADLAATPAFLELL